MPRFAVIPCLFLTATYLTGAAEPPEHGATPIYANKRDLLFYVNENGRFLPVRSPADWNHRKEHVLAHLRAVTGSLPEASRRVSLDLRVNQESRVGHLTRRKISFVPEPGDRVEAYLFVPQGRNERLPAVLCLHQTINIGKDEPAGLGNNPDLSYALELAERGFVTLAPDYWRFGERAGRFDPYQHGYASGTMKGIWDHMRAVDLLETMPQVDVARIGAIGHSLGGHNALFLAVFDPRIRAVVSSCGFNSFYHYAASEYGRGNLANWATPTYMPRISSQYGDDPNRMPFDWTELLACLAPRPVFINAPVNDENFSLAGVRACVESAAPVYELLDARKRLVLATPEATHTFPRAIRDQAYSFLAGSLRVASSDSASKSKPAQ